MNEQRGQEGTEQTVERSDLIEVFYGINLFTFTLGR